MSPQVIVRTPGLSIAHGLTTSPHLGQPNYSAALMQHKNYISTIIQCGAEVIVLPPAEDYPDSCFVEDAALLTENLAILTRPGAVTRQGEVALLHPAIKEYYRQSIEMIKAPGTLEAGDVLQIGKHFYIGLSQRTNFDGASQLQMLLRNKGYESTLIPLQQLFHLKTGVSYIGKNTILVYGELINHPAFSAYQQIIVSETEAYAANCIRINNYLILPEGYPQLTQQLIDLDFKVKTLDVSEFRKIDGGLSCLSLRLPY